MLLTRSPFSKLNTANGLEIALQPCSESFRCAQCSCEITIKRISQTQLSKWTSLHITTCFNTCYVIIRICTEHWTRGRTSISFCYILLNLHKYLYKVYSFWNRIVFDWGVCFLFCITLQCCQLLLNVSNYISCDCGTNNEWIRTK